MAIGASPGSVATGLTLVISQGSTIQVNSGAFNWLGGTAVHTIPVLFFIILAQLEQGDILAVGRSLAIGRERGQLVVAQRFGILRGIGFGFLVQVLRLHHRSSA